METNLFTQYLAKFRVPKKITSRHALLAQEILDTFSIPQEQFKKVLFGVVYHGSGIGEQKTRELLSILKEKGITDAKYLWGCINKIKGK